MGARRSNQIGEQFAPRLIEMLESAAYRVLSLSAQRALSRIEIELAHHGGKDNGKLPVTYDDFQQYGIDRHSIRQALSELEVLGFIEITEPGYAGPAEFRRPSKYRLTFRHTKLSPTNEWKRVQSKEEATKLAKRAHSKNKSRCGKIPVTVWNPPTKRIVEKSPLPSLVGIPPLLSIFRVGISII